jgi:hypothetical protein
MPVTASQRRESIGAPHHCTADIGNLIGASEKPSIVRSEGSVACGRGGEENT